MNNLKNFQGLGADSIGWFPVCSHIAHLPLVFCFMDYSEQLKDVRWKKKRLKILKRDKFTCRICGYFGDRVNVHHLKYTGVAWDAPDKDLITLCFNCHRKHHMPDLLDKKFEDMALDMSGILNAIQNRDGKKIY